MSYVQENLLPNEKVLYTARIHPAVFLPAGIYFLLGVLSAAATVVLVNQPNVRLAFIGEMLIFLALIFFFFAIVTVLQAAILRMTTEFAITDRRVVAKAGFIRRHTLEMLLQKVESMGVTQTLGGRILNYGTITLTGTGGTKERFTAIAQPLAVRKQINLILERYVQAQPEPPPPVEPAGPTPPDEEPEAVG